MELRLYARIVWKRVWIPISLIAIVLIMTLLFQGGKPSLYSATMRFVIGLTPEPRSGDYYTYDRYYTWLTAEYLIDDLAEIIKSASFASAVREEIIESADWPTDAPGLVGAIQGSTSSGKLHRILTVTITWNDPDQLTDIANAVVRALAERAADYFPLTGCDRIEAHLIDPPVIGKVPPSLTERLRTPVRLFLALLAGIAITFLLHYLDDTIQTNDDLIEMGLPVLGEIPPRSIFPWARRQR